VSEEIKTKTYRIVSSERIELGWFVGSSKMTLKIPIVWEERYTDVLGAQADLIVKPDANTTGARLYMNGSKVSELLWAFGEVEAEKSITRDVIGRLRNGENIFEIECFKTNPTGFPPVGFTVSSNVVITYTGLEPQVRPLTDYIVAGVAAVGAILFLLWRMRG
jgi:hypothetical protein